MKKLTTILLSTACVFAAGSAFADLTVTNNSATDSTMLINGNCTAANPFIQGITKSGTSNTYASMAVDIACGITSGACNATLYAADNCDNASDVIGTGSVDVSSDLVTITSVIAGHSVVANGTSIVINK
jgi:hypothetical protein